MNKQLIFSALIIFIFVSIASALTGCDSQPDQSNPDMDAFARCLTEKGFKMYGTNTCPHCNAQKEMFGESFKLIDYTGCDEDQQACIDAEIVGVPAWDFPGGERLLGAQELSVLAEKSGCQLVE